MKFNKILFFAFLIMPFIAFSQEENKDVKKEKVAKKDKPQRPAFEGAYLIDNATDVVYNKGTMAIDFGHRFGVINTDKNDMLGIWGASNIRLGISYSFTDWLSVGFGTTKFDRLQDLNAKVAILRQTRSGSMPISLSYYGNVAISAEPEENFSEFAHRMSYFNQVIVSRRFNSKFSVTASASLSHYNVVEVTKRNDMVAVSLGGRYKIGDQMSIIADYSQPLTKFMLDNPNPGISAGIEISTSSHVFQFFITNYNGMVMQKNMIYNQNDFFDGAILFGFNISRIANY